MAETLTFQKVLDHLLDSKKDIPRGHLQHYSDLDPKSLRLFSDVWSSVKPDRKLLLLDQLVTYLDEDTIANFESIGSALLDDIDGEVRSRAIQLLAESNDPNLVDRLTSILLNDTELAPRIEAAHLLGEFIVLGELEELKEELQRKAENALLAVIRSEDDATLRKFALEAVGYSSRPDIATTVIESAFKRVDPTWVASALRAMGRSHDDRWNEDVVSMLLDDEPRIRFAAVEAAGELSIESAGPILLQILEEEEEDDDVVAAAIWSLSQIGGDDARIYLVNLIEKTEDEDVVEFLEDALINLDFLQELNKFDLLSLDDLEEMDEIDEDESSEEVDEDK